jgi:hypothetical protein
MIFLRIWPVWAAENKSVEKLAIVASQRTVGIHAKNTLRKSLEEEGLGSAEEDKTLITPTCN